MFTVGIDLGTTTSVVAFIKDGVPQAIETDVGKVTTPSVVSYSESSPIVGREAVYKADSSHTIFSIKRFMGGSGTFLGKSAVEVSADILRHLKNATEQKTKRNIDAAVITVPAHFSDLQRTATKQAASIAGIKVFRLINEPTAAAIAFGLEKKQEGIFAVYDFGGGTFDFSILRLENGVFQVLATGGDNQLGGDDIDNAILEYNFLCHKLDINSATENERLLGRLVAKSLKERLGSKEEVCATHVYREKSYEFKLSQNILKNITSKILSKTIDIAEQVFIDSGIKEADGIVLVGGMSKLNLVKDTVAFHFSCTIYDNINPEEAVAFGAAIHANSIANKNNNVLLIDVVPLTLGIETFGGGVDRIIYRNTPIPIIEKREYTTYQDNQTGIKFTVVQGERPIAEECRSLATFELKDIPPMPAGIARVIVEFSVDVNGLLSVKAYEKNSGIAQSIIIEPSSGLSDDEMVLILEKAFANKKEDAKKVQNITIKVESERMIKFWESIINEIPFDAQKEAKIGLEQLKKNLNNDSYENAINDRKKLEKLFGLFLDEIINLHLSGKKVTDIRR